MSVRTRFAPSPTGYMHVGNLRTALYCYLMSKKHDGQFLLRIEDTDQERLMSGTRDSLINLLKWCDLEFDEGPGIDGPHAPYVQSERLGLYREHAEKLLKSDHAYRCFCTKDDLDKMRELQTAHSLPPRYDGRCRELSSKEIESKMAEGKPFVIRQSIPVSQKVIFEDGVRGRVTFHTKDLEDQVLMKSDGFPTYQLANVVDDHLMEITHVFRGEEWIPSTPKNVLLYEAFGWEPPKYVHLPLILNSDRSKLSKRQGDVSVEAYVEKGFSKEAILNFIALLGWNPGGKKELYSLEEMIEEFSVDRIQKSGAVFNLDKFKWFNWQWQRRSHQNALADIARKLDSGVEVKEIKPNNFVYNFTSQHLENLFLQKRGEVLIDKYKGYLPEVYFSDLPLLTRSIITVEEKLFQEPMHAPELLSMYFDGEFSYDKKLFVHEKMGVTSELAQKAIKAGIDSLKQEHFSSIGSLKEFWIGLIGDTGLKTGQVLWPTRVALSNSDFSPGVFEIAWSLGYEKTLDRLAQAYDCLAR